MRRITGNPYDEIEKIVKEWCDSLAGEYGDFLVTIMVNSVPVTEYLEFDASDIGFVWNVDWWEGEKDIVLCGFIPKNRILIRGDPDGNELVEEGENKYSIRDRMIKEAIEAGYIKVDGND